MIPQRSAPKTISGRSTGTCKVDIPENGDGGDIRENHHTM